MLFFCLENGDVERILTFWDWQLGKFYSPKFWSRRWESPKVAGTLKISLVYCYTELLSNRIVEFANSEDAQRAVRELSEMTLLGRPVYIREVRLTLISAYFAHRINRIVKMNLGLELHQFQVKWAWLWLDRASTQPLLHVPLPTISLVTLIQETNFTSET